MIHINDRHRMLELHGHIFHLDILETNILLRVNVVKTDLVARYACSFEGDGLCPTGLEKVRNDLWQLLFAGKFYKNI